VYVKQIVDLVRSLEAARWTVPVPFRKDLTPLGSKQAELKMYDKLENYGTSDLWLNLLRNTANTFDLAGVSLRWWTKLVDFRPILLQKAKQGCKIRCLLNPAHPHFIHTDKLDGALLKSKIREAFLWFNDIATSCPNFEVRQIKVGGLTNQIVRTDDTMLIAMPLYSRGTTSHFPLIECSSSSPLFQAIAEEYNSLWTLHGLEDTTRPSAPNKAMQPSGPEQSAL
jgi:hypothetical protein